MKRRILSICACAALIVSGCYDDSYLDGRIGDLEEDVTEIQGDIAALKQEIAALNTNVSALQTIVEALQNNVYVEDVYEVKDQDTQEVIGYTIVFTNNEIITIYHGEDGAKGETGATGSQGAAGKDGSTPVIGLQLVNGVYCWTVNGELLKDSYGNAVPATGAAGKDGKDGATPQFRITDGLWEVSFDGSEWEQLGSATGTATATDAVFSGVKETSEGVIFILADGSKITIPRAMPFGLVFEKTTGYEMAAGSTIAIPYTVTNATDNTVVDAIASGFWTADVVASDKSTGVVNVTASEDEKDGKVLVYATDGYGNSDIKTLVFANGVLRAVASATEVPVEGGDVTVTVTSNIIYTLNIPEDAYWVSQAVTKAGEPVTETITLLVAANETPTTRTAAIELCDAQGCIVQTIAISQNGNSYVAPVFDCDNFKSFILANYDIDRNGELSSEEVGKIEEISYSYYSNSGSPIASFAGVESFYNLKSFVYDGNYIYDSTFESIDLTKNGRLETIEVKYASSAKELKLEGLKNVKEISIASTSIETLDLSSMSGLKYLRAQNSSLTSIDLSANKELVEISVYGTKLSSLDVSPCVKLVELNAGTSTLEALEFGANTALASLTIDGIGAASIDFSTLSGLTYFQAYTASLEVIDLSGSPKLTEFYGGQFANCKLIDVSAAAGLSTFNIYSYYKLEKVRFSKAVEDKFHISGYWGSDGETYVYVTLEYVEGDTVEIDDYTCYISDEYVRKHIIREFDANGNDKIDADEVASVTELDLSEYALASAAGLEMFPLEKIDLSGNRLTEFDGSQFTSLKWLDLSDNMISTITAMDDAEDIEHLDLSNNCLSGKFDDRNLPSYFLTYLDLSGNTGATIDPYYMTSLVELRLANTAQSSFYATDIAASVKTLDVSGTQLSGAVKFSRASSLETLDISNTQITSIDVTKAATNGCIRSIVAANTPLSLIVIGSGNSLAEGTVSGVEDYVVLNVSDPSNTATNEWGYIKAFTAGTGAVEQDFNINYSLSSKGFVIDAGGEASITLKAGCKMLKLFALGVNGTPSIEISRSSGNTIYTASDDVSSWGSSYISTGENPLVTKQNAAASKDTENLIVDGNKDYYFYNLTKQGMSDTATAEDETITFKVSGNAGEKVIIFGLNMSSSRNDEE